MLKVAAPEAEEMKIEFIIIQRKCKYINCQSKGFDWYHFFLKQTLKQQKLIMKCRSWSRMQDRKLQPSSQAFVVILKEKKTRAYFSIFTCNFQKSWTKIICSPFSLLLILSFFLFFHSSFSLLLVHEPFVSSYQKSGHQVFRSLFLFPLLIFITFNYSMMQSCCILFSFPKYQKLFLFSLFFKQNMCRW